MKKFFLQCLSIVLLIILAQACKSTQPSTATPNAKILDTTVVLTKIAFGSCNKQYLDQSYWDKIAAEETDLWVWLGDNIYADTRSMRKMKGIYNDQKNNIYYKKMNEQTPVIGIWDDHDYGKNDAGSDYVKKVESKKLMLEFLDVPKSNPAWNREGGYQSYSIGSAGEKVKFILLDARYFRDELEPNTKSRHRYLPNENGTILGDAQWEWLEKELKNSDANIHIIASGIQFIATDHFFEKWSLFPEERERLFELIKRVNPKNPMLWSGDRHISEVSKIDLGLENPLYDITCSGLTHAYEGVNEINTHRVSDVVHETNYGLMEFEWSADSVRVKTFVKSMKSGANLIQEDWFWSK